MLCTFYHKFFKKEENNFYNKEILNDHIAYKVQRSGNSVVYGHQPSDINENSEPFPLFDWPFLGPESASSEVEDHMK